MSSHLGGGGEIIRYAHASPELFRPNLRLHQKTKVHLTDGLFSPGGGGEIRTPAPDLSSLTI